MIRLRPCPFCGSDDVEIVRQEDEELQYNEILCHRCGATVTFADCECTRGYETRSADETVRMWNMRGDEKVPVARLYVYKKAGAMTGHRFTDDVAIVYAESIEDAIKTFSKLYADVTEDEVEPVIFNSKDIAILTDY